MGARLRLIRLIIYWLLDGMCTLLPRARRRVALVLRLDAIGDYFIWMQSGAREVSEFARRDGRRAVLIGNHRWTEYACESGLWDQVVGIDPVRLMRNPLYRVKTLIRIRRLGAEVLIQPRAARVYLQEDSIARIAGADLRIGNAGTAINASPLLIKLGNRIYQRLIPVTQQKDVHETIRNGEFVKALTGKDATRFTFGHVANPDFADSIVVSVGAGQMGRVWPIDNLASLLRHVKETRPKDPIVLLGAPSDAPLAKQLAERSGIEVRNLVGTTSLAEVVAAIAASRLVICNDSSAYHIAMALDKNVLCFLGGGHFGWYAPYPADSGRSSRAMVLSVPMDCFWCNWRCKYPRGSGGSFRCVASIPVQAGIEAIGQIFSAADLPYE